MDFKSILNQVAPQIAQSIAGQHGLDQSTAQSATQGAIGAILGGLTSNVQTSAGAQSLDKALATKHNGSVLKDVAAAAASAAVQQEGSKILGHVFGSQTSAAADQVATKSGVSNGTASSILSAVAPLVLGALGQAKRAGNLDAQGVGAQVNNTSSN